MTRPTIGDEVLTDQIGFIRRLAAALLVDREHVPDVVQETLRIALERRPDPGRGLRAWLASVVRNLSRHRNREVVRRERRERRAARAEAGPGIDVSAERAEDLRRLGAALQRLPRETRELLGDRYFDELPPREIARRREIPVNTVRTRLRRALQRLRVELDEDGGPESWERSFALWLGVPGAGLPGLEGAGAAGGSTASASLPKLLLGGWVMSSTLKWITGGAAALLLLGLGLTWRPAPVELPGESEPATSSAAKVALIGEDGGDPVPVERSRASAPTDDPAATSREAGDATRGTRVFGSVHSRRTGQPLSGVKMLFYFVGAGVPVDPIFGASTFVSATSDDSGSFEGELPVDARELVRVLVPRWKNEDGEHSRDVHLEHWVEREVDPTQEIELQLQMPDEFFSVRGRVVVAGSGAPVPDARITGAATLGGVSASSDADGRFALLGLVPGDTADGALDLRLEHPGYPVRLLQVAIDPSFGDREHLDLELEPGWAIQGRVVDEQGRAQPRAIVSIEPAPDVVGEGVRAVVSSPDAPRGGRARRELMTSSDGSFRIEGLPSGHDQVLRAERRGGGRSEPHILVAGAATEPVELVLRDRLRLRVTLVADDGSSFENGQVELAFAASDGLGQRAANEDGSFEIELRPSQRVRLHAFASIAVEGEGPAYYSGEKEIRVEEVGGTESVVLSRRSPEGPSSPYPEPVRDGGWGGWFEIWFRDQRTGEPVRPDLLMTGGGIRGNFSSSSSCLECFVSMGSHEACVQFRGYRPAQLQLSPREPGSRHRMEIELQPLSELR